MIPESGKRLAGLVRLHMPGAIEMRAFSIHIFTACGAALGLVAMILAAGGQWAAMFFCLGVALAVDAADGPMARANKVAEVLPRWSGETLDLVVDFVTYVFVPAFAIAASGYLPDVLAVAGGMVIVVTGALYFADRSMKAADNYFCGFPAVWNVAAFYLFLLKPPSWLAAIAILALATLSFAPVRFVHPVRVKHLRPPNVGLMALWAVLAAYALMQNLAPGGLVTALLTAIAVYFFLAGLLRQPAS
jgi:phosphatidylcholine synthase